jgi:hypothetical protein
MRPSLRRPIAVTTALALTLAAAPPAPAQTIASQTIALSRADYEACQTRDEAGFRAALQDLTLRGLDAGLREVDYRALVSDDWRRVGMDDLLDKQVDAAVAQVREETSWTDLIRSIASPEQAQALATTVAERVYKSEPVKAGIEDLAAGVGRALGKRIEFATAEPARQCMTAFLGPRFGTTLARVFSRDASREYAIDTTRAGADVSATTVLKEGAGGITGAIILIVRRQLQTLASRLASRLVGTVLSRVVGAVAGGVGVVLIAKDIWDFRNGVLPIIASEMKARATKVKVQEELARAIQEQLTENKKDIAAKTADRIIEVWQEFRRSHRKVLALSEAHPEFKAFLEDVRPDALARLGELVSIVSARDGDQAVLKRLADGSLARAVNEMPASGIDIARETRSLDTALGWWAIAGDRLDAVVASEITRLAKPDQFTSASLTRLLNLGDRTAIQRLAAQTPAVRAALFDVEAGQLRQLARALDETQLTSLAGYLTGLDKAAATRVLSAVAATPARMQVLGRPAVVSGIVGSTDQAAAVGMMLRSEGAPDPFLLLEHVRLVTDGRVAPLLLWEKHPVFVVTTGVLALMLLAMLKRALFGRRPRVVVERVAAPNAPRIKTRT